MGQERCQASHAALAVPLTNLRQMTQCSGKVSSRRAGFKSLPVSSSESLSRDAPETIAGTVQQTALARLRSSPHGLAVQVLIPEDLVPELQQRIRAFTSLSNWELQPRHTPAFPSCGDAVHRATTCSTGGKAEASEPRSTRASLATFQPEASRTCGNLGGLGSHDSGRPSASLTFQPRVS